MLAGVGLSMAKGGAIIPYPETIPGLKLWLRYNTGHISENDETTLGHDIDDGDRIKEWNDYSTNDNPARQLTAADMPLFESDDNSIEFSANSRWFDLRTSIGFEDVFTLIMRVKFSSTTNDSLFGHSSTDFFRITNNKSFRAKIGGTAQNNFTESTNVIEAGAGAPYYIIVFQRDSDDNCYVRVHGDVYENYHWGGAAVSDSDAFTISNVGCQADDVQEMGGNVKDVLVYEKYLTETQLLSMYTFLDNEG